MAQSREKRASMKYRKEANLQGVYWPKRGQIETIGFLRRLEALWRIDHDGLAEHLSWRLFQEGLTSGLCFGKIMHPVHLNNIEISMRELMNVDGLSWDQVTKLICENKRNLKFQTRKQKVLLIGK